MSKVTLIMVIFVTLSASLIRFINETQAASTSISSITDSQSLLPHNETKDELFASAYYDPKSGHSYRVVAIKNNILDTTRSYNQSSNKKNVIIRRIGYRSNGCTCHELACGCCLGINVQQFNFSREGCMNFTYDPDEFGLAMDMYMNENLVFSNFLSARDPPPLCIPLPVPYLPTSIEFCAKLFDIHTPGQNLQMCFDFETRVQRVTVFVMQFDCMRMGRDGVAIVKPGETLPPSSSTESQVDSDVYDEVTEIKYTRNITYPPKRKIKTII